MSKSTDKDRSGRSRLKGSPAIAAVTLLIAILGAVTGTWSFFQQQHVTVRLRPQPFTNIFPASFK